MRFLSTVTLLSSVLTIASGWVIGEQFDRSKALASKSPLKVATQTIMDRVDSNLTTVIDETIMAQLDSVLMIEKTRYSKDLRAYVQTFKEKLVIHMRSDLTETINETTGSRTTKGPMTDDEKNIFADKLHDRWENTLREELSDFRDNLLPKWVSKAKKAWQGFEDKVKRKMEKFKDYMHRHSVQRGGAS